MNTEPLTWPYWRLLAALIVSIALVSYTRSYLRLRHIPGPRLAAFSKLWLLRKTIGGRFHLDTIEACAKYGPIVRIGPNELITNDLEVLRRISAVRSPYTRAQWYDGLRLDPERNYVLSERDEKLHNALRSKMFAGYSGKENDHLEEAIDCNVSQLVQLLESKYLSASDSYKPVDLAPKIQYFTLDVISDIAFGKPFGKETDKAGIGKLMGIARDLVAERFGPDKKVRHDMLGSFIRHGLAQEEAQSEALLQILAGAETSAIAIRVSLLYTITNPQVYNTLLAELSTSSISDPITDEEARRLPYLQAVIKEGLRIFPPVSGPALKDVPKGGDTLEGLFIPGGTTIGWSPFGMMREEAVWGPDANLFRPERWLEGSAEEKRKKEMDVEMVFGYGKYLCLGKNVAYMELNKVLVQLLRNFNFAFVDPTQPWKTFSGGLIMQSDMWMRIAKRAQSF